jgi:adenylate cyclase
MNIEIERKFLVHGNDWHNQAKGVLCRQGYLVALKTHSVRVRIMGNEATITIKGATSITTRMEFEYKIPMSDGETMLAQICRRPLIEKYRYTLMFAGDEWVIDQFIGDNQGLIVAEIELRSEDQHFAAPPWLGREVTGDSRYLNSALAALPFNRWDENR